MNLPPPTFFSAARRLYAALLLLVLFSLAARAEEQRWLFVFDTSSTMKKRLPEIEKQIKILLTRDFAAGLHEGDSLGVWTFNESLTMGKFPLITWQPWQAGQTVTNLTRFIHKQSYSGNASFTALQPTLGSVIEDSERLTVVIICAGTDEIHWTPYDEGMNETMKQTRDDRQKIHQPYVIVLRTQLGKYVGATVNFPPLPANLPPFPLLPREIKALPAPPTVVVVPKPVIPAPPLIITGTHVSINTNEAAEFLATNQPPPPVALEKSNVPAPVIAAPQTPVPPVAASPVVRPVASPPLAIPTAVPVATAPPVVATVPSTTAPAVSGTNAVIAVTAPSEDRATRILTYVGIGLLGAALALVIFLFTRSRPGPQASLITSSMQNDPRPPEKK